MNANSSVPNVILSRIRLFYHLVVEIFDRCLLSVLLSTARNKLRIFVSGKAARELVFVGWKGAYLEISSHPNIHYLIEYSCYREEMSCNFLNLTYFSLK